MIRKTLTALCAVAALAGGFAANASAKEVTPTAFTLLGPYNDGILSPDTGLDTVGTLANAGTYTLGQTFDELFLVQAPDISIPSMISFDAYATNTGVKFTGIDFGAFAGAGTDPGSFILDPLAMGTVGLSKYFVFGQSANYVDSGMYYIELTGVSLANGGSFTGDVSTAAIPEPGNAALLLAGLGVFATMARRRKQAA